MRILIVLAFAATIACGKSPLPPSTDTGTTPVPSLSSGNVLNPAWVVFNRAGGPDSTLQCYTPNNVSLSGGYLNLVSRIESATCSSFDLPSAEHQFTSGFVAMRTFNFVYGTVEAKVKFAGGNGAGSWPVLWMQDQSCQPSDPTGTDDNCNEQEIDIAEILQSDFNHVNQQIHTDKFAHNDGCNPAVSDASQSFHIYRIDWQPGSIVFSVDGQVSCTISQPWVPSAPMYVKINNQVGGRFAGPLNQASLPWTTSVDYIKVTQNSKVIFFDDFGS